MSPAIFANKWRDKFNKLLEPRDFHIQKQNDYHELLYMYHVCVEGFNHYKYFLDQVAEISLSPDDYNWPSPPGERDFPTSKESNARSDLKPPYPDEQHAMTANPHRTPTRLVHLHHKSKRETECDVAVWPGVF